MLICLQWGGKMPLFLENNILIHRIMSSREFEDLVVKKSMRFSNPSKIWSDEKEGYLFKQIRKLIAGETLDTPNLFQGISEIDCVSLRMTGPTSEAVAFAQSWSVAEESKKMWEIYSHDDRAIRVTTSWNSMGRLLTECLKGRKEDIFEIKYYDEKSLDEKILDGVLDYDPNGNRTISYENVLRKKTTNFAFEQEIRVFITGGSKVFSLVNERKPSEFPKIVCESIRSLSLPMSEFISNVILHPSASDLYCQEIEKICAEEKINFSGKSRYQMI